MGRKPTPSKKRRTKPKLPTGLSPEVKKQFEQTANRIREIEREALAKIGKRRRRK